MRIANALGWFCLVAAFCLLGWQLDQRTGRIGPRASKENPSALALDPEAESQLERELAELEQSFGALRADFAAKGVMGIGSGMPELSRQVVPVTKAELILRLEALEQLADDVLAGKYNLEPVAKRDQGRHLAETKLGGEAVQTYQDVFLDENIPLEDRMEALGVLSGLPSELQAMDAVIPQALALFDGTTGERERERFVEVMDGVNDPRILDWAIGLVRNRDGEAEDVRYEASKILRKAGDNAHVLSVAQELFDAEPSERIRKQLVRLLGD